jgi:hypothetical protein
MHAPFGQYFGSDGQAPGNHHVRVKVIILFGLPVRAEFSHRAPIRKRKGGSFIRPP